MTWWHATCLVLGILIGFGLSIWFFLSIPRNAAKAFTATPTKESEMQTMSMKIALTCVAVLFLCVALSGCANLKFAWTASYQTDNLVEDLKAPRKEAPPAEIFVDVDRDSTR